MTELKCPFCQKKLVYDSGIEQWCCDKCHLSGGYKLWQELIRTRKALGVAIKYIKHTQKVSPFWFNRLANKALEQITALEQKE